MRYAYRQAAEDRHTDDIHPLHEFAWLLIGSLVLLVAGVLLAGWFAGEIAARLPFRFERQYAAPLTRHWEEAKLSPAAYATRDALRQLGTRVARDMEPPADMPVSIHYLDGDVPNAMATLGGNVFMWRGLIGRLKSEDALAFVLAHELAHVQLRHPITGLGRGVAIGTLTSVVSAGLGGSLGADGLGRASTLPLLDYSREQERAADAMALRALARHYGHLGGAAEVFKLFDSLQPEGDETPTWLRTHPHTAERAALVSEQARQLSVPAEGKLTPLPPALLLPDR
ncbi:MAG: M48 family metallopeptidase [Moraxellaceae bacterium]|nr:M48 family metallopeptidase [Moraxellaceae bacterium]